MAKEVREWLKDIERREKAIKRKWRDEADKIIEIYEAEDDQNRVPFNILYSNTETLLPALYNSTPRPEVTRRFTSTSQDKTIDVALSNVGERVLEYTADSNVQEYQTFDETTRDAVLAALVPGMGNARVRLHEAGGYQEVCFESVPHDRFVWAYARKWQDVPWVAYGYDLIKEDFESQFPEFCRKDVYRKFIWTKESEEESPEEAKSREDSGVNKQASVRVWELWYAPNQEIKFLCEEFKEDFLKEEDYPFPLTSRFPSPAPLQFIKRVNNLMPKPPYKLYESQARELNELTVRLKLVVKAIKVRGAYNAQMTEIAEILKSDDTALVPVQNASVMGETGGFDKHIWLMPLAELITVAKELYASREGVKATIYEIMGIGDILRGASVASETAKAQEIKNQWGSLRVKRMQKDVQIFCRDLFRVAFEFAANLYSPATLQQITKMPYLLESQKQQIQMQMQMMQQQAAMTGQPPPPPDPQMQLAQAMLAAPSWENISEKLRDQYERTYRIDVETNSTVDLEATEDKAQIAEFMNAWGQMMSGITPLVESGAMPFEAAKVVMGEVFRRFRFARRVEQALDTIQQPQPKEDPKVAEEKNKAEIAKVQAEAKRQIGEMQESLIEYTGEIERLKTENNALKLQTQNIQGAAAVEKKSLEADKKLAQFEIKADYEGKRALMQQEKGKMVDDAFKQEVMRLLGEMRLEMQAFKQEISGILQSETAEPEENGSHMKMGGPNKVLQGLMESQMGMMEAIKQVAAIAGAEREAELFTDEKGNKKSRSRIVLN